MLIRLIEDGKPEDFQQQIYDLPVIIANQVSLITSFPLDKQGGEFVLPYAKSFVNLQILMS